MTIFSVQGLGFSGFRCQATNHKCEFSIEKIMRLALSLVALITSIAALVCGLSVAVTGAGVAFMVSGISSMLFGIMMLALATYWGHPAVGVRFASCR